MITIFFSDNMALSLLLFQFFRPDPLPLLQVGQFPVATYAWIHGRPQEGARWCNCTPLDLCFQKSLPCNFQERI